MKGIDRCVKLIFRAKRKTAKEYSLADALFEGTRLSLVEALFGQSVAVVA